MVYVAYGVDHLDLTTVPAGTPVVVVHNDDRLQPTPGTTDVRGHGNVGFAAGANLGLAQVTTPRVVFCNPDTALAPEHWEALLAGAPDEVVSVPMVDGDGRPASVVNAYPTPLALVLTGYRAGRLAARGSLGRTALQRLLGRWGSAHATSSGPGTRSLQEAWCSGALFSVDAERVRAVRGFDDGYFLYFEDADLCRRLARAFPAMTVRTAGTEPALHTVGGSAHDRRVVDRHFVDSAIRYASSNRDGWRWRAARFALDVRARWLGRR